MASENMDSTVQNIQDKFEEIGIKIPKVLLPKPEYDLQKWSVIACDQYTSQARYWDEVENLIGADPSTYRLVAPEIVGREIDKEVQKENIWKHMSEYLDRAVFGETFAGFVLVERRLKNGRVRKGLVVALDLEHYDYLGEPTMIRTTEGTIVDRLPDRVAIREGAPIELPHIMVLIDDPDRTVIEPLFEEAGESLYDFELMQAAGHIKGYKVEGALLENVAGSLSALVEPESFAAKYGVENQKPFLYAMGDGNHSFAAAKVVWDQIKEAHPWEEIKDHPARYGLAELVNLHDESLEFEGIHRLLLGVDGNDFFSYMSKTLSDVPHHFEAIEDSAVLLSKVAELRGEEVQALPIVSPQKKGLLIIDEPIHSGTAASLHNFLDPYLEAHPEIVMDYVHDPELVMEEGAKSGNLGIFLPALVKGEFFGTIIHDGPYPRKTFSLGEADDKRFYLEVRKIRLD
jgi:hypothetical protein